jgi:hypothetical protein
MGQGGFPVGVRVACHRAGCGLVRSWSSGDMEAREKAWVENRCPLGRDSLAHSPSARRRRAQRLARRPPAAAGTGSAGDGSPAGWCGEGVSGRGGRVVRWRLGGAELKEVKAERGWDGRGNMEELKGGRLPGGKQGCWVYAGPAAAVDGES